MLEPPDDPPIPRASCVRCGDALASADAWDVLFCQSCYARAPSHDGANALRELGDAAACILGVIVAVFVLLRLGRAAGLSSDGLAWLFICGLFLGGGLGHLAFVSAARRSWRGWRRRVILRRYELEDDLAWRDTWVLTSLTGREEYALSRASEGGIVVLCESGLRLRYPWGFAELSPGESAAELRLVVPWGEMRLQWQTADEARRFQAAREA